MKTEVELLELYAEAYKERSIEGLKDYISAIIQYLTPDKHPQLLVKSQFLSLLQSKFDGQKKLVPLEKTGIMLVYNESAKKENIYIDFGNNGDFLFSIEVNDGLIEQIDITKYRNENITIKKTILKKLLEESPITIKHLTNYQRSKYFNYLDSGMMMILEEDNPDEVIDVIIKTNYPYESCIGENFKPQYLMNLMSSGFYIMSVHTRSQRCLVEAMHHLSRSVLFFDHLHIKKSIKKYLLIYELRENTDFDVIVDKCVKKHNNHWLSKQLVEAIKEIHNINNPNVTFISFGLYRDGILVAGDFGSKVGRIYSSYSGFFDEDNSGSVQMILTAQYLEKNGFAFWDLGMPVEYKSTIGAKIINLEDFIILWRDCSKQNNELNLEYEKHPLPKHNLSEEQLLWELRNAYRYFYIDDLQDYLLNNFHYASQHVFEEIKTKEDYLKYLKGKLRTIQNSNPPNNELLIEIAHDFHSNRPYLYLKQNNNEALFVAEVNNGRFVRLDLCIPDLYSFIRKSEMELFEKAYIKFCFLYKSTTIIESEKKEIILFIKNVCLQFKMASAFICKKCEKEEITVEEYQKYGLDGMGKKLIEAYKLLISEGPIFPSFIYSILDKMEKIAKLLKNDERQKIVDEIGEIVYKYSNIKGVNIYYAKAISAYLHFEKSDDEKRKYVRIVINLAIENQKDNEIIKTLISLLKSLLIYNYDIFEEYYNDGLFNLIKENTSIKEFENFDKLCNENKIIYEKRKTEKINKLNEYRVEYVLYNYNEKCNIGYGGTAYHQGYIIFYDNHVSIEDHEVDRDDWDDAWHGHHSKNIICSENYNTLIEFIKSKYYTSNDKTYNNEIFSLLKTETERILFKLMLDIIHQNKGIMYGGRLARIICEDKIEFHVNKSQYDDFYPDSDSLNYDKTEVINKN